MDDLLQKELNKAKSQNKNNIIDEIDETLGKI